MQTTTWTGNARDVRAGGVQTAGLQTVTTTRFELRAPRDRDGAAARAYERSNGVTLASAAASGVPAIALVALARFGPAHRILGHVRVRRDGEEAHVGWGEDHRIRGLGFPEEMLPALVPALFDAWDVERIVVDAFASASLQEESGRAAAENAAPDGDVLGRLGFRCRPGGGRVLPRVVWALRTFPGRRRSRARWLRAA